MSQYYLAVANQSILLVMKTCYRGLCGDSEIPSLTVLAETGTFSLSFSLSFLNSFSHSVQTKNFGIYGDLSTALPYERQCHYVNKYCNSCG